MPAFSAVICVLLSVTREAQMPEPAATSFSVATTGPIAVDVACRRLAPVPVMPLVITTEVSELSRGRNTVTAVPVAVLDVGGNTSEPDSRLV